MKALILFILVTALSTPVGFDSETCTCKGVLLTGKAQVVRHFGQFKVKVVTNFEDLEVEKVKHATYQCGQWEIVDNFGDFTIEYVPMGEDFTIRFKN